MRVHENQDNRKLVRRSAAAEMLDCSVSTLVRMERENRLKPVRLRRGGNVFYCADELESFLRDARELDR